MNISITNLNGKTNEEVLKALEVLGVEFISKKYALEVFFEEESEFRLREHLINSCEDDYTPGTLKLLKNDEHFKNISENIADKYFNSVIFNYDYMDDIVSDEVENYILNNFNKKEDEKENSFTDGTFDDILKEQNIQFSKFEKGYYTFKKNGLEFYIDGNAVSDFKKYSNPMSKIYTECFFDTTDDNFVAIENDNFLFTIEIAGEHDIDIDFDNYDDCDATDEDLQYINQLNPNYEGRYRNEKAREISRKLFEELSPNVIGRLVKLGVISTEELMNNWLEGCLYVKTENNECEFVSSDVLDMNYKDFLNVDLLTKDFYDAIEQYERIKSLNKDNL